MRRTGNEREEAVSVAVANSINPGLQPAPLPPPSEGHTMSLADTFVKALAKAQKLSKETPLKVIPTLPIWNPPPYSAKDDSVVFLPAPPMSRIAIQALTLTDGYVVLAQPLTPPSLEAKPSRIKDG